VLGQILDHRFDLILWQGRADIEHHMEIVAPSLLAISGTGHRAQVVTLHTIRLDRLFAIPFG
jgi:hypothetical protein